MTALLFDRDRVDEVEWNGSLPKIGRSAILWIDLERASEDDVSALVDVLGLDAETARTIGDQDVRPSLEDHDDYLHVRVIGLSDPSERRLACVDCLVSERWLVTLRECDVEVVGRFRERAEGSGDLGRMDGLAVLANLVEWALTSYLEAFEVLEADLEEIDAEAMTGQVTSADGLRTWSRCGGRSGGSGVRSCRTARWCWR
jgi:Mg2+ and Co2+ transporter CorA